MKPNKDAIRHHLTFLFETSEYDDGQIEIAYTASNNGAPSRSEYFQTNEINKATDCIYKLNANEGVNVYVGASLRNPDTPPFGRSNANDFYCVTSLWADLDEAGTVEASKELYKDCPPSLVVVTGRHPHTRSQYWWKLEEPHLDIEETRETLAGLCEALNGDVKVVDPARIMRVGGTIAWPKKEGRIPELTEVHIPKNKTEFAPIERIQRCFPCHNLLTTPIKTGEAHNIGQYETVSILDERITDGRDKYMSDMVYASIQHLCGELERWPTAQEVFDDCWPVYSAKVVSRSPKGLDAEGRGSKHMEQKINSKLRSFQSGRFGSIETIINENKRTAILLPEEKEVVNNEIIDEITGEIIEVKSQESQDKQTKKMYLINGNDVVYEPEDNDFVQGMLTKGSFSVVYGESNCGKTFFMTDLSFHVSNGKSWLNKRVDKGAIIYVALEGVAGLKGRIEAYRREKQETLDNFYIMPCPFDFLDASGDVSEFLQLIANVKNKIGEIKMIVVDTLARAIGGGDENSGQDMGMLVKHADAIREYTGAHICFVHHSGKDKARGARGHSSLRAAVDTEIEVSRNEGDDFSVVKVVKQRDLEKENDMAFKLKTVEIGENQYFETKTSCVVEFIEMPDVKALDAKLNPLQQFIYDAILDAVIRFGSERNVIKGQPPIKSISYDDMHCVLEERGYKDFLDTETSSGAEKMKNHTTNARVALHKKGKIGFNNKHIWLLNKDKD